MHVIPRVCCIAIMSMGALATMASGQAGAAFVGTWRLVSYESRDSAGAVQYPFGQGVVGQLSYDAGGKMSAMLMKPDRPLFASQDLRRGTDVEVRAAFDGFIAYFGTYTVDATKGMVTHHVRAASYPNWVGGDQVRYYKFDGTRLVLSTPPIQMGSRTLTTVLVWQRMP
jgi:lipocalin-like protein